MPYECINNPKYRTNIELPYILIIILMTSSIAFIYQQQKCVLELFEPFLNLSLRQSWLSLKKMGGVTIFIYVSQKTFLHKLLFYKNLFFLFPKIFEYVVIEGKNCNNFDYYFECKSWSVNILRLDSHQFTIPVFQVNLFVWFDSLRLINKLSVKQGRVFLGSTGTKLG